MTFYKYTVIRPNGTKISGWVMSDKPKEEIKSYLYCELMGEYELRIRKYELNKFPCNSDYVREI
jgi:hypothetical protein